MHILFNSYDRILKKEILETRYKYIFYSFNSRPKTSSHLPSFLAHAERNPGQNVKKTHPGGLLMICFFQIEHRLKIMCIEVDAPAKKNSHSCCENSLLANASFKTCPPPPQSRGYTGAAPLRFEIWLRHWYIYIRKMIGQNYFEN